MAGGRLWTEEELQVLKEEYAKGTSTKDISKLLLNRAFTAIKMKASDIGITRQFKTKILYFVTLSNGQETFDKVGTTSQILKYRVRNMRPYKLIKEHFSIELPTEEAEKEEKELLASFINFKYTPKHYFKGAGECITI